ncbi:Resolvase, N terminal domain [Paenibacillus sophorae]|uniref:Recombinase family protein n=1 Tax=Paenibacillus sophorae TaxID=1333845 RepID=A0A1H8LDH2_9BACL|nr:recombinase family protein [Paenibacillus sophorae]QWU17336.1 recombinase family protein [Paenibacillus sophorae]SEO02856.1 Resolvase, N terminal domain [Paenibacillus sophorae]
MKAAIYARTATKEQSIEAQITKCKEFIESLGGEVTCIYSDEGFSANDHNRPSLRKLIEESSSGDFNTVVSFGYARIFRNVFDLKEFEFGLNQQEIELLIADIKNQ